jgi:hypothetical protein
MLHSALLQFRFERAKAQIAELIEPDRVVLLDSLIEQLAKQSQEYVSGQGLEIYVPDGVSTPLHDTPGVPWHQYREGTLQILLQAIEDGLRRAKGLLDVVEAEKGFEPAALDVPEAEALPVEIKETELVLAL